jgi:hypothetical protein
MQMMPRSDGCSTQQCRPHLILYGANRDNDLSPEQFVTISLKNSSTFFYIKNANRLLASIMTEK